MIEKFSKKELKNNHFNNRIEFQKKSNVKLIVAYEGTHYYGWQKTKTGPSIEEELEKALGPEAENE